MKRDSKPSKKKFNSYKLTVAIALSLTLGLAPFFPEPHIVGKLRWVAGGAEGMAFMDYFDLMLHGFPWILLLIAIIDLIRYQFQ